MDGGSAKRSGSGPRPSSRPTTPLRPNSRSSLRNGGASLGASTSTNQNKPVVEALEPQFAELADSMADLEANFMHLQLMHESLARFSESFASFLYGLNMNAFCVDFPEAPIAESIRRDWLQTAPTEQSSVMHQYRLENDGETTFLYAPPHGSDAYARGHRLMFTTAMQNNGYVFCREPTYFLKGYTEIRYTGNARYAIAFKRRVNAGVDPYQGVCGARSYT